MKLINSEYMNVICLLLVAQRIEELKYYPKLLESVEKYLIYMENTGGYYLHEILVIQPVLVDLLSIMCAIGIVAELNDIETVELSSNYIAMKLKGKLNKSVESEVKRTTQRLLKIKE